MAKILIVDDEKDIVGVAKLHLESRVLILKIRELLDGNLKQDK